MVKQLLLYQEIYISKSIFRGGSWAKELVVIPAILIGLCVFEQVSDESSCMLWKGSRGDDRES